MREFKRHIFVVTDKNGNPKDENGRVYGYYLANEEELCKAYCKTHDLTYRKKTETYIVY